MLRGAALDHNDAFAQHSLQPRQRFFAALPKGDDLGDHRVEFRRDESPTATPVSIRTPGPVAILKPLDQARGRRKSVLRILGVQPHFDGVTDGARLCRLQTPTACNMNLQLDQVEPGGAFGHRVFDLQAGIHLHEHESLACGLVEELDRARRCDSRLPG